MYQLGGPNQNPLINEVFQTTTIMRKPITGIVSGYHELPYILVAPDDDNPERAVEISGKVNVSPKFIISPQALGETFGQVFDPETFDRELEGRVFSFAHTRKMNLKVESEYLNIKGIEAKPSDHADRIHDELLRGEDVKTGLILGPRLNYYPVSLDRFIVEISEREFNV
ncbi:MAG: hypothetical protein GF344_16195 [Chitinivibrionales bacterium]|nr:hypothetical protein [Chitinivibrionales bacterium]MBD3358233.1 hypothetical protein [Chitinivibrionales bacterium]